MLCYSTDPVLVALYIMNNSVKKIHLLNMSSIVLPRSVKVNNCEHFWVSIWFQRCIWNNLLPWEADILTWSGEDNRQVQLYLIMTPWRNMRRIEDQTSLLVIFLTHILTIPLYIYLFWAMYADMYWKHTKKSLI